MSKRQLPPHANLRQLRTQAKDLLKGYRADSPDALSRVRDGLLRLSDFTDEDVRSAGCTLQDMQHVLAVEYGFEDWACLRRTLELSSGDTLKDTQDAIRRGDLESVERLLSADPDLVNRREKPNGETLLHIATYSKDVRIVALLIEVGADVEATSGEGWRPLHNAAGDHCLDALTVLLEAGADPTAEACGGGGTALVHALFHGDNEAADLLASHAVEPANLRVAGGLGRIDLIHRLVPDRDHVSEAAGKGRGFYRHHAEYPEWTPADDPQQILDEALVYAAHNGRVEAVDVLIEKGATVNGRPYYATALHQAVIRGDRVMVEHLLSRGANPTIQDEMHGGRAYDWADYSPNRELKGILLEAGSETDLYAAVKLGMGDQAEKLSNRASSDSLTRAYKTAVREAHTEIAQMLKGRGARPTMFDLIELGLTDEVALELANGGDANVTRVREVERIGEGLVSVSETVLQAAASARQREIGKTLADSGAEVDLHGAAFLDRVKLIDEKTSDDIDRADAFGMTPLHRAIQGGSARAIERLLALGASVSATSDTFTFGGRAIHVAAEAGASAHIIDLLIAAGADVNEKMNPGSPLRVAERSGQERTAEVLRTRGAIGSDQ